MQEVLIEFAMGTFTGGLSLSACWGLWWLMVGTLGFSRGTCSWRVLWNSLVVCMVSLLLASAVLWLRGTNSASSASFVAGLAVVPLALLGLGIRQASDGRRAGAHMLDGVRQMMDDLLGKHHECRGCGHDHEPRSSESSR
jgi:hypothetical protein